MPGLSQKPVFTCGSYRIDVGKRQMFAEGAPLTVTAKAFDILVMLAARAGDVVTKEELLDAVWAGTAVEENNLTQQISALRKIFGERAGDNRFIATVPGRGYCFVAPVEQVLTDHADAPPVDVPGVQARGRAAFFEPGALLGTGLGAAYVFLIFFAVILFDGRTSGPPRFRAQSVSILTFRSIGAGDERLSAGIRDTLRAKLGNLDDLTVRPGSSETAGSDAIDMGRRMNVDVVLAGSVQRDQDRIRVAVEMVDVRQERIVWGKTFDENASNIFRLQDVIAAEVLETLRQPRLSGSVNDRRGVFHGPHLRRADSTALLPAAAAYSDRRRIPALQFS